MPSAFERRFVSNIIPRVCFIRQSDGEKFQSLSFVRSLRLRLRLEYLHQ